MSNQLHGKDFEYICMDVCFPGAHELERDIHSFFDIEAEFDTMTSLNTQCKTKKIGASSVEMADARKFFANDDAYRLLIGCWKQNDDKKIFTHAKEFIFSARDLATIKGNLTYEQVKGFHDAVCLFGPGKVQGVAGQAYAKHHKKSLPQSLYIALNPKIDSKKQRRLQCSLKLNNVCKIVKPVVYNKEYRGLCFPLVIKSSERQFNK